MARNEIYDYSEVADDNTDIGDIFVGEGWDAPDANGAIRELLAQLARFANSGIGIITPERYGAVGDGVTDDRPAFVAAFAALTLQGGGVLQCNAGKNYKITSEIVVPTNVFLHLNTARITGYLNGGTGGCVRLTTESTIANGSVYVVSTNGGASGAEHAPIILGMTYGQGGTAATPNPYGTVRGAKVLGVEVSSDKDLGVGETKGAAGIAVIGDVTDCIFDFIVPDNAHMTAGLSMDWGVVGEDPTRVNPLLAVFGNQAIVSDDTMMTLNKAQRTLWDTSAGTQGGYTTHPNGNIIRGRIGRLTRAYAGTATSGSFGVRFSGTWGNTLEFLTVDYCTESAFNETAGDLGFEYARPFDVAMASMGNRIGRVTCKDFYRGNFISRDSNADNVERATTTNQKLADGTTSAVVYTPIRNPLYKSNSHYTGPFTGYTAQGANAVNGFNVGKCIGGIVENLFVYGAKVNLRLSGSRDVLVNRPRLSHAWNENILVEDGSDNITLFDPDTEYANTLDSAGTTAEIKFGLCTNCTLHGGRLAEDVAGAKAKAPLIAIAGDCVGLIIRGQPLIRSHRAGGGAHSLGAGGVYGTVALIENGFRYGANVTTKMAGGQDAWPVKVDMDSNGNAITTYQTYVTNDLDGMTLRQGDTILFYDSLSGGFRGRYAVASGLVAGNLATLTSTFGVIS